MNTTDALYERGRQLMSMDRIEEAIETFRKLLIEDADYPMAHAMLSLCFSQQLKFDLALNEANRMIGSAPDMGVSFYVQGVALFGEKSYREGLAAIDRAIALEPEASLFHTFRARLLLEMNRPDESRESCLLALRFDPEYTDALSLLAIVESQKGNREAAEQAARAAVQSDPNDADSYIALGYQCAFANRPKEAFEAFREALRLDPNSEQAHEGLLLALQMHHFLYRRMFAFFAWLARLSTKMQWVVVIGFLFFQRITKALAKVSPTLSTIFLPIFVICITFCLLTWVINPLSYVLLLFNRWGRLALSAKEKATGIIFALLLLTGGSVAIGGAFLSTNLVLFVGLGLLILTLPVTSTLEATIGVTRTTAGVFSVLIFLTTIAMIALQEPGWFIATILLFIAFQFVFTYVAIRSQKAIG